MSLPALGEEELLLLPYVRALEALKDRKVTITVVAPPYPALGRGTLHVVRVLDNQDSVALALAYDDYEKLK